ncbi:MAG TPA: undecaprenyldiphospho-muramoylpentapeptide beta-N-acetylglucosaminyltransferase [Ktedonobacterales bacterium]|nr:undecaprenyldiphospho-muramoylpentapeptide beta-N-acetylglucosaminyltransferase [Ktedonobacterales bacterium]HEX5571956.1 undecaprenyldiphospho-muramoylpentapeptide beta-N-acetylglucosaminyltransferase [Ktedonobacterales bacterium]
MRILISGGGTGGHIYPALAVASELRDRYGAELLYIGDENGLETRIVPDAGFRFVGISAGKLRRYLSLRTFSDLARVPVGMRQAYRVVRRFRPDAAFTSGGYVSVPAGMAARLARAPLVMHQQDVPPNLANRLLNPFATRVTISFAASQRYFPPDKTILIGNPVREEVLRAARLDPMRARKGFGLKSALPIVLVTGGSQGARRLNQVVAATLPYLLQRCQVLHVSGELTYEATQAQAARALADTPDLRERYALFPYLKDSMPQALAACDIALCRSGAATLAELSIIGRPSVLVPLPPGFTGSPQAVNAAMFEQAGAAVTIRDRDLTPRRALELLEPLLGDANRRVQMSVAARKLGRPTAASDLADLVAGLAARLDR